MHKTTTLLIVVPLIMLYVQINEAGMSFVESGDAWGLTVPLKGIMAHAAACGDIDGDGDLDLYVGNFCDRAPDAYLGRSGPVPNLLLINEGGRFREADQAQLSFEARTSGAVFVDLDNDGDLDLYVSNNSKAKGLRVANRLFENVDGRFREFSGDNDACVVMGGRSIGVLDYDGDGLLDLLVAEDMWTGRRTRLLRNGGRLRFDDVSMRVGLPADLPGLGVITPDLNDDGRPDIFVAQANRLFLSRGDSTYSRFDSSIFQYEPINREACPCGVAFGDLNRDGRMDIVIVDHSQPARQHLYINMGLRDGVPEFQDVTTEAGLDYRFPSWTPEKLHLKHGHVEVADFDNDGRPDILVAATYSDTGVSRPFVCRNISKLPSDPGRVDIAVPRFHVPPVEEANAHFAAGPVGDYNRDGRLDIFLANWFPQKSSKLYLNRDTSNHWLRVRVVGRTVNRMGIGSKVKVYPAGELGREDKLLGFEEIGTGFGFCSGQEAVAHFGLGELTSCDVEIVLPHGKGAIHRTQVQANQLLVEYEPLVSNSEEETRLHSTSSPNSASPPHIPRLGKNLVSNPTVKTSKNWSVFGNAVYESDTSRGDDGSGSFRLVTPYYEDSHNSGRVFSDYISVEGGKKYTAGFFAKTANGPTYVSIQVSIHAANKTFLRNLPGIRSGTSQDGRWQECALPVFVPKEAVFARVQAIKMANTCPGGRVWVDDFYFAEGIGLKRPPSAKRAFAGAHVRVDRLGNFEIGKHGRWMPFFPLCMYSDNNRDPAVYSKQGWNVIIWTASADAVQQAKRAVSDFNPDGMLAGFQISQYTFPSGWAYKDLDNLQAELREVFDRGLAHQLLLYYWDNENNYGEWAVPVDVINTIKSIDVDSSGKRLHPIYALQGNYGIARVHAARGLVDVSGTYVGGGAAAAGGAGSGDLDGLFVLDRLEGQTSPAAFAQFNGVIGPGDMRLRLYNSLILGAKAMGYWRDCYGGCSDRFQTSVGPVDKKAWWPDFPKLRREVDRLLPLIREPHWTAWQVNVEPTAQVRVGTRNHQGEGYLILVNQTAQPVKVTLTLEDFPYEAKGVWDYFSAEKVAAIQGNVFTLTLPAIGVGSGTRVVRIARPAVPAQR